MQPRPARIDAHHHVWDLSVRDQPWTVGLPPLQRSFSYHDLVPELAAADIDRTVLVQTIAASAETPELLALAEREERIAGVVGWVDLTAGDVGDRLDMLRSGAGGSRLIGIRHQVQDEVEEGWLSRPDVSRGLAAVGEADLAYDLLITRHQLAAAVRACAEHQHVRFVLDHAAKPAIASGELSQWQQDMIELAALPNVAVKLSGLVTEADHSGWRPADLRPYSDVLLGCFGPDRIMFGSDWPVCLLAASYAQVVEAAEEITAELSESESIAVFGGTASSWYRIDG